MLIFFLRVCSTLDSPSRMDEEHKLIARYAARLSTDAGNTAVRHYNTHNMDVRSYSDTQSYSDVVFVLPSWITETCKLQLWHQQTAETTDHAAGEQEQVHAHTPAHAQTVLSVLMSMIILCFCINVCNCVCVCVFQGDFAGDPALTRGAWTDMSANSRESPTEPNPAGRTETAQVPHTHTQTFRCF